MVSNGHRVAQALVAAASILVAACATFPTPEPEGRATGGSTERDTASTGTGSTAKADVAALQGYVDLAYEKLDQGAIAEGIQNFVTVLSELNRAATVSDEDRQFGATAEEELNRIGSGLNLTASVEWVDAEKNQIAASTLDVGTPDAMGPSVTLTYSYGGTRTVVAGAPVVFEFVKGAGSLVSPVTTNDFGQANTTVTGLDNARTENVIRATVVFRVRGFAYTFRGASRDFAYVPPVKKATILVLERATLEGGNTYVSSEPVILDRAYNVLKNVEFGYTPYNGSLLGDDYMKVFGGENAAIRSLGLEEGVSYLIMVLSDTYYVRQVELNGKKYELYSSKTNGTTRIIRAADGAILYSGTVQAVDGQGNTAEKAIIDGFRGTADRMAEKLGADLDQISRTLLGS